MKKLLALTFMFGAIAVAAGSAEAKTVTASVTADPQIRVQIGGNRNRRVNRRVRTVVSTRIVRQGAYRYRETIRTTYLPNGRTRTQVISRVRIGGYHR
jgi:hypothetical protein